MKKFLRWAFILLTGLLVILGIASGLAWYYKPEITQAIHEHIREKINGEFDIQNISLSPLEDFPNISVTLENVDLRGPRFPVYKKSVFTARKIHLTVSLFRLLRKEVHIKSVSISGASLFIFRTQSGYTNLDIIKPDSARAVTTGKGSSLQLSMHAVYVDDVKLAFYDSLKEKVFALKLVKGTSEIVKTDSSRQFQYEGKVDFDRLEFNKARGSYLLGESADAKLNVEYSPQRLELVVRPSTLRLLRSTLGLTAKFDLAPEGKFELHVTSADQNFEEGLAVLPATLAAKLAKYRVLSPFAVAVDVHGETAPGHTPHVDVKFSTKDTEVGVGKYNAQHVSMTGTFTNHHNEDQAVDDKNSVVAITSFSGIFNRLPISGLATFSDLENTFAHLQVSIEANAQRVQNELDSTEYRINGGRFAIHLTYDGKLTEYLDPDKSRFDGKLDGRADLKNASLMWVKHGIVVDQVNAAVSFTESRFLIEKLSFLFNSKSPVTVSGAVIGFVPFFSVPSKKGSVKLNVSSADLNLTPAATRVSKPPTKRARRMQQKMISDLIDKLYSKLEFDVTLDLRQLKYLSFKASDVTGNITLGNNQLQAKQLRMKLASGNVQMAAGLTELQRKVNPLWIRGNVQRAEIREFFSAFNNFNQKTITGQNLSGKIDATINLNGLIDDDLKVVMPSLRGKVELSVKKGKLTKFAPLQGLGNFLFKNRDFSDIDFAEIHGNFALRGTELSIGRMEVESSVISLFLEGRYSLGDSTDLSIQLPLSNLKARDKNYKPKNVGVDSKVGPSVFLRARRDDKGAIAISYDPFKKFRKK